MQKSAVYSDSVRDEPNPQFQQSPTPFYFHQKQLSTQNKRSVKTLTHLKAGAQKNIVLGPVIFG